ncbi:MAG: beta strand repeat-containing protein [Fimbriiglobus sp.]
MRFVTKFSLAMLAVACVLPTSWGQTFNFVSGTNSWNTAGNWTPSGVPNGVGVAATFNPHTAAQTTTLDAAITAGSLSFVHNTTAMGQTHTLSNGTSGSLTMQASSGNALMTVNGTGTLTNGITILASVTMASNLEVVVNNTAATGAAAATFTGAITGSADFIKSGAGRLSLTSVAKAYTGATIINQGRLRFTATGVANATSAINVASGGQLNFGTNSGAYNFGAAVITINGTGTTETSGQLGALRNEGSGTSTLANAVTMASDSGIHVDGSGSILRLDGNLSGAFTLTKTGGGTLTLNAANAALTGGNIVTNGTIIANATSRIGNGALSLAQATGNNTAVTLLNSAQTVGNLNTVWIDTTGTQTQTLTLTGTALTVNQTADTTFGNGAVATLQGIIAGTGSVTLSSTSTNALTLTGTNTYTGGTTISGGTLVAGNTAGSATGTGTVTVNNTGTLAGTGIITGATTVTTGGTIRGGTGILAGNLTTGNVTVQSGGNLFANLAASGTSSKLLVGASTLDLKTGAILKVDDISGFSVTTGGTWNIAELTSGTTLQLNATGVADGFQYGKWVQGTGATGPIVIDFSGLPTLATGDQLILSRTGNNLVLEFIPVPEPTTMLGLAAGLLGLGAAVRKKFFTPAVAA